MTLVVLVVVVLLAVNLISIHLYRKKQRELQSVLTSHQTSIQVFNYLECVIKQFYTNLISNKVQYIRYTKLCITLLMFKISKILHSYTDEFKLHINKNFSKRKKNIQISSRNLKTLPVPLICTRHCHRTGNILDNKLSIVIINQSACNIFMT